MVHLVVVMILDVLPVLRSAPGQRRGRRCSSGPTPLCGGVMV
jgi:hypothetical protein